ncbi:MAG: putative glycoside hydrolase [Spirochaetes bacterium]|nr:putative glycoside hydrolase [Spirochaetota bacterium]
MKNLALSVFILVTTYTYAWQPLVYQAQDGTVYYKGKPYHHGLPKNIIIKDIQLHGATLYITTQKHGLFKLSSGDSSFNNITPQDARMRSLNGLLPYYRSISAFCVDSADPATLYVATKYTLYCSCDGGRSWNAIALSGLPANACITALYAKGKNLLVGTSWNGVYQYNGNRFVNISNGLPSRKYSDNVAFIEEVYRITPEFCITAYTNQVYSYNNKTWTQHYSGQLTHLRGGAIAGGTVSVVDNNVVVTLAGQNRQYYELSPIDGTCALLTSGTDTIFVKKFVQKKDSIRGLYAGAPSSWKDIKELVAFAKKTQYNALVIDIKDDYGYVYVNDETAASIGALRKGLPAEEVCRYLHAHNIKAIARMVVFKDEKLFKAFNNKYAIKDSATKAPWRGNPKEYWVDQYAEFVHQYNISIAKQAQAAGFDEVQFDYIRFPTDGPVHRCMFSYKPDNGIYKYEAIAAFCSRAKEMLRIPVSVDVYGFTVWYEFGQWLGQDIEAMTSVVDVVCPMVYPSHYGRKFFGGIVDAHGYYAIVFESVRRATMNSQAIVRPYLQAFDMLSPRWGYVYIQKQIQACVDAGVEGYLWWNAGRDYGVIKMK